MSSAETASKEMIANNFATTWEGKLDQEKIEAAARSIQTTDTSYPARGSVVSRVFYSIWKLAVDGGKTFTAEAGGEGDPADWSFVGDVYTNDINALYSNTVSFEVNLTPVYMSMLFFDGDSNLLAHFQGGASFTVVGVVAGKGSWS
jgi:Rhodococcus equi virulence-associated protein